MILYHYTTLRHFLGILQAGQINTTHSELLRPVNLHLNEEGTAYVDEATDDYKPVVWLTSNPQANPEDTMATKDSYRESKVAVRIGIERRNGMYLWEPWAKRNGMESDWMDSLKRAMPDWKNVYVYEKPIPTSMFATMAVSDAAMEKARRYDPEVAAAMEAILARMDQDEDQEG